jgi:hypothetical protein
VSRSAVTTGVVITSSTLRWEGTICSLPHSLGVTVLRPTR